METNVNICGGFVRWTVPTWATSHSALAERLQAAGFGHLAPNPASLAEVLEHALRDLYQRPGVRVRPIRGGFTVVQEDPDPDAYWHGERAIKAKVVKSSIREMVLVSPVAETSAIVERMDRVRDLLPRGRVTTTLTNAVAALGGVTMEGGSLYWLPDSAREAWAKIAGAVQAAGPNRVYWFGVERTADTVEAVTEALRAEVASEIESLTTGTDGLRDYDLARRRDKLQALVTRAERYEHWLGTALDDVSAALDTAERDLMTASVRAS